jgi:class 3 adenylate cyclase
VEGTYSLAESDWARRAFDSHLPLAKWMSGEIRQQPCLTDSKLTLSRLLVGRYSVANSCCGANRATERVERRLAAILAADVAGYSRLMGADEAGALRQLKAHRRALVDTKIAQNRGRIVKTTGDGMLVEFASFVDAVRCAVEVQRGMAERNVNVPEDKRIEFRIGINVGDIITEGTPPSALETSLKSMPVLSTRC